MRVIRFDDAQSFADRTLPQLARNEAANNLMIGIAGRLCEDSAAYGDFPPYLAAVEAEPDDSEFAAIALMTAPYSLIVQSESPLQEQAFRLLAFDLMASDWDVPGVNAPIELARAFADIWTSLNDCSCRVVMQTRAFELRKVDHPRHTPGSLRVARPDELARVVAWAQAFTQEALDEVESFDADRARQRYGDAIDSGAIYFWDDNGPVSMAGTGRRTAHGANIGLVYTPPTARGHGYASACVAALSQKLLDDGWDFCTLFTDLANPTSNRIYQRIGFRPIGDFTHLAFE